MTIMAASRPLCPRCGFGTPNCGQLNPDGTRPSHQATCANYYWDDDVCQACRADLAREDYEDRLDQQATAKAVQLRVRHALRRLTA